MEEFATALLKDEPIFQVDAVFGSNDIGLRPNLIDITNTIVHSVKDFLERLKSFRRWMDGTCLLCQPVMTNEEPYIFSFFEDVLQVCLNYCLN